MVKMSAVSIDDNCEYFSLTIAKRKYSVKLAGTTDDPYFCGEDICNILKCSDKTLQDDVPNDGKKFLKDMGTITCASPYRKIPFEKEFNYSSREDGYKIYINEKGLDAVYSKARCPMATGEALKLKLRNEILPLICQFGRMRQKMNEKREQENQKRKKWLEEINLQVAECKTSNSSLGYHQPIPIIREKKLEWIYIAATPDNFEKRFFRIGFVELSNLNALRKLVKDKFQFYWKRKCYFGGNLLIHIQKLLLEFKYDEKCEFYAGIKFEDLRDILEFLCDNYDKSVEYVNDFVKNRFLNFRSDDQEFLRSDDAILEVQKLLQVAECKASNSIPDYDLPKPIIRKEKLEWIYIAADPDQFKKKKFKIGFTARIAKRLLNYNVGKTDQEEYKFYWKKQCYFGRNLEYYINKLLEEFKYEVRKEIFVGIQFEDLCNILEFLCDNYDKSVEYVNDFVENRLEISWSEDENADPWGEDKEYQKIDDGWLNNDIEKNSNKKVDECISDKICKVLENEKPKYWNKNSVITIKKADLMHLKDDKTGAREFWNTIKSMTGWVNSNTVITKWGMKFKIEYFQKS